MDGDLGLPPEMPVKYTEVADQQHGDELHDDAQQSVLPDSPSEIETTAEHVGDVAEKHLVSIRTSEAGAKPLGKVSRLGSVFASIKRAVGKVFTSIAYRISFGKDAEWRHTDKYNHVLGGIKGGLEDLANADAKAMVETASELTPIAMPKGDKGSEAYCKYYLMKALQELHGGEELLGGGKDLPRNCFKRFMTNFRAALETKYYTDRCGGYEEALARLDKEDPLFAIINKLSLSLYTGVDAQGFSNVLVDRVTDDRLDPDTYQDPSDPESSSESVCKQELEGLEKKYDAIKSASRDRKISVLHQTAQSIVGECRPFTFDPMMQGNPPYKNFEVERADGKTVVNVRMSTPTRGGKITPEFKAYLRALKAQGKKHMYANLQRNNAWANGETTRSLAIQELAEDPEFKDVFVVVTLDKNSAFYSQKGKFAKQGDADTFKQTFLTRMFDGKSGFYIPESLKEHREAIEKKLDFIHQQFFEGKAELSREQRQDFIEIAYTMLTDFFVDVSKADYYNASCKDCIDRGGGANALMFFTLNLMQYGKGKRHEINPLTMQRHIESFAGMMFAPALWARKRPIIKERMERAVSAAMHMLEAFANKDKLKAFLEQMSFSDVVFEVDKMEDLGEALRKPSVVSGEEVREGELLEGEVVPREEVREDELLEGEVVHPKEFPEELRKPPGVLPGEGITPSGPPAA